MKRRILLNQPSGSLFGNAGQSAEKEELRAIHCRQFCDCRQKIRAAHSFGKPFSPEKPAEPYERHAVSETEHGEAVKLEHFIVSLHAHYMIDIGRHHQPLLFQ